MKESMLPVYRLTSREVFFKQSICIFSKISHNAEKLKKRPFRLIKRFYKPKTLQKNAKKPFDRIRKFSKKKSHSTEKKPKSLASTFGSIIKFVV